MSAAPGKPQYKTGEQVVVTVTLTSREKSACRTAGVADGVVTIGSMTRDGAPVVPVLTEGNYIDGFTALISGNSVSLEPGKTVSMSLAAEGSDAAAPSLTSSTQAADDGGAVARWPVGQTGSYLLTLAYRMPPIALPSPACRVSAAPVSVAFVVTGS